MPIYEYQCNACKKEFERLVFSGDDGRDIDCPECQSRDVSKKMSAASFMSSKGIGSCAAGSPKGFS